MTLFLFYDQITDAVENLIISLYGPPYIVDLPCQPGFNNSLDGRD